MSLLAGTGEVSQQANLRLRQFLRWAGWPNFPIGVALAVLALFVGLNIVGLFAAAVIVNGCCAVAAERLVRRDRVATSLYVYSGGVYLVSLVLVLAGEPVYSLTVPMAVLPVVTAAPYVPERALLVMFALSMAIVAGASVLFLADWSSQIDEMNADLLRAIVAGGVVGLSASIVLSIWHTRYTMEETRLHLESANQALQESERVLEARVAHRREELREANGELTAARDAALSANRHKSEFLANMSHELRTPLNAILGFSEVLTEEIFGDLEPKQLEYTHDIHDSGRQLLALINNILDIAKIEAGRWELSPASFDLRDTVDDSVVAHQSGADAAGVTVTHQREADECCVVADERALRRVVDALINNAIKFSDDGGTVGVSVGCDSGNAVVTITDHGIGIAPKDIEVVFDEFRQAEAHYTHKRDGTGLGLALARRMVELHQGHISVDSALGAGSTFTIVVPTGDSDDRN